ITGTTHLPHFLFIIFVPFQVHALQARFFRVSFPPSTFFAWPSAHPCTAPELVCCFPDKSQVSHSSRSAPPPRRASSLGSTRAIAYGLRAAARAASRNSASPTGQTGPAAPSSR